MKKIKYYVGRTVEDGLPSCGGETIKDCEQAIQNWLNKQIRNKPIQMWEIDAEYDEEMDQAEIDPFNGGKKCSVIFQHSEYRND